ncbi:M60 family metallopeptidase [Shigella sonnei]
MIWHEVGHNAAKRRDCSGAPEVASNVLALYRQDRYLGKMNRVADVLLSRRNIWRRARFRHGRAVVRATGC